MGGKEKQGDRRLLSQIQSLTKTQLRYPVSKAKSAFLGFNKSHKCKYKGIPLRIELLLKYFT